MSNIDSEKVIFNIINLSKNIDLRHLNKLSPATVDFLLDKMSTCQLTKSLNLKGYTDYSSIVYDYIGFQKEISEIDMNQIIDSIQNFVETIDFGQTNMMINNHLDAANKPLVKFCLNLFDNKIMQVFIIIILNMFDFGHELELELDETVCEGLQNIVFNLINLNDISKQHDKFYRLMKNTFPKLTKSKLLTGHEDVNDLKNIFNKFLINTNFFDFHMSEDAAIQFSSSMEKEFSLFNLQFKDDLVKQRITNLFYFVRFNQDVFSDFVNINFKRLL